MLKELIELRQIKSERESILRTNQYYIAQVSQMEIKISELKASLQAKDSEISYLSQKLSEVESKLEASPQSNKLLEDQLILLQAENDHLKLQLKEAGEISQIKIQLEYALKMKETFEEKYREAKILLLTNKNLNFEASSEPDSSKLKLQDELEMMRKKMMQLQNQCSLLTAENDELFKKIDGSERDEPRPANFSIHSVKSTPKNITSPEPNRYLVTSSSTNYSEPSKIITRSIDLTAKSTSQLPRNFKSVPQKVSRSFIPTPKAVVRNDVAQYCPSFMRNKKNDVKTTPSPSVKKNSMSSFHDDFPEEEEF
jgi:hypothetical protein